jgi:sigma-B regulation protein RsbU (phosphoserine phosphatase)
VGDVTGKGITASVLMTATQGFLHASLLAHGEVAHAVDQLNRFIQPRRPESRFVTMWLGVFDVANKTLTYVDAGHSFAILRRADGRFEQLNKGAGLPVGLDEAGDYRGETIAVQSGDQIMVVSDGIIEQFGIVPKPDGTMSKRQFQMEGLQEVMSQVSQDIVQDVFAAVIAHAGTDQLSDDATAVLVKWQ